MFCEQSQLGELGNVIAQCHGKRLNKRAAAGGTCLIQHDAVDAVVLDLEALDVLSADVDDEIHLRTEERSRLEVCHRFDNAEVHAQSGTDQVFSIAGDGTAADLTVRTQVGVQGGQFPLNAVQRLSLIGSVELVQQLVVFRQQHDLGGGGAGIDAQIRLAGIGAVVAPCHIMGGVAFLKPLVFLRIAEQRLVCHQSRLSLGVPEQFFQFCQGVCIRQGRCRHGTAICHKGSAVFGEQGVFFVQFQRSGKGVPQPLQERQRAAQKQHVSGNASALCQTGNRLVHHCLKDAGSDVLPPCSLIQQGLNVRLGEHAAAGSNGIHLFGCLCHFVQLIHAHVQQGRHLVDKGTGTAGTAAVHTLLHAAGEEDDLGIFAAQFNHHIGFGIPPLHRQKRRMHFLHKGQPRRLCQTQTGRTGDADTELDVRIFLCQ